MSTQSELARSRAAVTAFRATTGVLVGLLLVYLGATGKVIPAGGLPKSAEWGRLLGERGVCAVAIGVGIFAMVLCGWWLCNSVRTLRQNRVG